MRDQEVLTRIAALGIPPAWRDVWICSDPRGHLQATGVDAAGRKQYRYHDAWRTRRDAEKFEDMTRFARALPALREHVAADLASGDQPTRERVLAAAVRLLDRGFFRIGSEQYTVLNESYGLATMRKEHVRLDRDGTMVFDYPAKSSQRRVQAVVDPAVVELVGKLKRRRGGGPELLAYRARQQWHDIRSPDINGYLKDATGDDFSAKDFRTWNATVLASVALAVTGPKANAEGGDHARRQGDGALSRQHAGGLPRVLHRPARVRRLPRRAGARGRRASSARSTAPTSCRSTIARSRRPCSASSTPSLSGSGTSGTSGSLGGSAGTVGSSGTAGVAGSGGTTGVDGLRRDGGLRRIDGTRDLAHASTFMPLP